jgi:hypothetical protein
MSSVDYLPGAYSQRVPQGGGPNAAIPDVVPTFIGQTRGRATLVSDEAVTRGGSPNSADVLANTNIIRIIRISLTSGGAADFKLTSHYLKTGDTVDWSPVVKLAAPVASIVLDTAATDGTLPDTDPKFYVIAATNAVGETLQSAEVTVTPAATTDNIVLSWTRVPWATGYKIYGTDTTTDYSAASSLVATIASGATTTYTDKTRSLSVGVPAVSNTAEIEPAAAATYYVTYEYGNYTPVEAAIRYTDLSTVFNDHGVGSNIAQMAELAMSTQGGRGNGCPACWLIGVQADTDSLYQAALTAAETITGEVLIMVMDKRTTILDDDLRQHIIDMNGVEERKERVAILWNAPATAIGATATPSTILYDAAQSASFDVFHAAPDSGSATALLANTAGVYAAAAAQGWHGAAILAGAGAALPDAATPWTEMPLKGLVAMSGTEYSRDNLKALRNGGVMVMDNVSGIWRVLEETTTLRTGLSEEKFPNISLADKVIAQLWRNTIAPTAVNNFTRRSLIGRKINDSLLEMVHTRTQEALDTALQRGLMRSYDRNSITVTQNATIVTQIDVTYSYVAFFPALTIIANRSFDLNQSG